MIDLHCHSYFSDGSLSPYDLLLKAIGADLAILALTDHDTIEGLEPLYLAANKFEIKIINGIELSVRWKKYDIHIIGLKFDTDNLELNLAISQQNENRIARAHGIADCLIACGIDNAYAKACEVAGHTRVARPHFAKVLVNEGVVCDIQTAFRRFLAQGRMAYVATKWLSLDAAVAAIVEAGGQAVIAHPLKYALTRSKLHELIKDFKLAGGVGMEVVSGLMNLEQVSELAGLCHRFDLLASSGSDYHGDNLSRINLGRQQSLPINCKAIWHQWNL